MYKTDGKGWNSMEARPVTNNDKKKEIWVIRKFIGEKSPEEVLVELIKAHTEK